MGLFSRDTTVYVSSVTYSLGEEPDKIPDLVKAAVITAGVQGTSRTKAIDRAIFDGMGVKLHQGYNYAKRSYYAGLPDGFPFTGAAKNDTQLALLVKEHLEYLYPPPANTIVVKSAAVNYGNNIETRARQLIEVDYKYDAFEDEVYEANNGLAVGAVLALTQLPADPTLHPNDLGFRLTFTNPDTSVVVIDKWYLETQFLGQEEIENRVVVEYTLNGGPAKTFYYEAGGADSRLNIYLRSLSTPQSGTFPAIVLKKALTNKTKAYLDEDAFTGTPWASSAAYKTSKAYALRMDIDIHNILDSIKGNADHNKIDYAFIQPGTKINSPNTAVHEYHFRYFHWLYTTFPNNKPAYDAWVASNANQVSLKNKALNCPSQSFRIKDPDDTKNTVNMELAWRYITYEEKAGTLPKAYTVECGPKETLNTLYAYGRGTKTAQYEVTKLYLRKRLTDSTYAEICVCGLWHENYVYKNKSIQSGVWDAFNDPDGDFGSGFVIPLQYEVFTALSGREKLQLAQEAFHLILNCYKIVKEKWYQTGIFKVILAIVAIVVIYYSGGTLGGFVEGLYGAVSGAVGSVLYGVVSITVIAAIAAVITAAIMVGLAIGISALAQEAGEWAAEQWGPAWGAVVQIIAILALSWMAGNGLEGLGMTIAPASLPMTVLNVTNAVLAGMSTYTSAEMALIKEAQTKWNDYIGNPNNPLEEVNRLLEELFPELSTVQQAILAPRETLDQFLGRTLTLVDGLTYRLTLPISAMAELTLTPRLT